MNVIPVLKNTFSKVTNEHIHEGFAHIKENTGLLGRWQILNDNPRVICDTGHNIGGFKYIKKQLTMQKCQTMRIVIGMVNDKDINGVLGLLPKNAVYYFCQASVSRALSHKDIRHIALSYNLNGKSYASVIEAYKQALRDSDKDDFIYVGGSTFVVADLLRYLFG